jgi:hypothetical protein
VTNSPGRTGYDLLEKVELENFSGLLRASVANFPGTTGYDLLEKVELRNFSELFRAPWQIPQEERDMTYWKKWN